MQTNTQILRKEEKFKKPFMNLQTLNYNYFTSKIIILNKKKTKLTESYKSFHFLSQPRNEKD